MAVAYAAVAAEIDGLDHDGVPDRVELLARRGIGEIVIIGKRRAERAGQTLEVVLVTGEVPCLWRAVALQAEPSAQLHAHFEVELAYAAYYGIYALLAALGLERVKLAGVYHPVLVADEFPDGLLRLHVIGDNSVYSLAFGIFYHFATYFARSEH